MCLAALFFYVWLSKLLIRKMRVAAIKEKWLLMVKSVLIIGIPACVILFTWVGSILYTQIFYGWIYPNVSAENKDKYCDFSNRLVETLQPLVSDESMIRHLEKNRDGLLKIAEVFHQKQHVKLRGGLTNEFRALLKDVQIEGVGVGAAWSDEPYSVESAKKWKQCMQAIDAVPNLGREKTKASEVAEMQRRFTLMEQCDKEAHRHDAVAFLPDFGRTSQQFYCTTRRLSFKQYKYYPGGTPQIENGRLLGLVDESGRSDVIRLVVADTDHINRKDCVLRKIDDHWFISLC